ncbi:glycosyltransferase family 2 protein [Thermodesulfovibrionales bacterium]|nr:glycosyltransferase family 2 protein [Thermodesulfovibrionales bacterium]
MNISIIISTYNRPDYLKKTIEGYLHQNRWPDEIIIADDGSTNDTAEMIKEIQKNSKVRILHIWHEDKGFRAARIRNKAVAKSSGRYLIICDDDSIPSPALVKDHLRHAEEGCFIQGHRVLLGSHISEDFTFRDISLLRLLKFSIKGQANNILNALHLPVPLIRVSQKLKGIRSCNMSFFKEDFIAVNGFNEGFEGWGKEDSELVVRFYKYGLNRKDIKFSACCYHLYHAPYSRNSLKRNIALLERVQKEDDYFCKDGIDKYL